MEPAVAAVRLTKSTLAAAGVTIGIGAATLAAAVTTTSIAVAIAAAGVATVAVALGSAIAVAATVTAAIAVTLAATIAAAIAVVLGKDHFRQSGVGLRYAKGKSTNHIGCVQTGRMVAQELLKRRFVAA